jgi:hypothetical protein
VYAAQVTDFDKLVKTMEEYLEDYNASTTKKMSLVMFLDAIEHVSRISRIIRTPLGNALLLGVGGSGRQSLTKLAAFIADYRCFSIEITKGYGKNEWREDLKKCLKTAGIENQSIVFLFTDTQIVKESFMEDINAVLNRCSLAHSASSRSYCAAPDDKCSEFLSASACMHTNQVTHAIMYRQWTSHTPVQSANKFFSAICFP